MNCTCIYSRTGDRWTSLLRRLGDRFRTLHVEPMRRLSTGGMCRMIQEQLVIYTGPKQNIHILLPYM